MVILDSDAQGAIKNFANGHYQLSIECAHRAIAAGITSEIVFNVLGASYMRLGKFEDAILAYKNLCESFPHSTDGYHNLGVTLLASGDLYNARRALEKVLELRPDHHAAYISLGNISRKLGDYTGAINYLNSALTINSESLFAYSYLSRVYLELNDADMALSCCRKAIELSRSINTSVVPQTFAASNVFANKKSLEQASSSKSEGLLDVLFKVGRMRHLQGDFEGAVEIYKEALSVAPNHIPALHNLGAASASMSDFEGAIGYYGRALKIDPRNFEIRYNLGNVLFKIGNLKGALDEYNICISINSKFYKAYNNKGNILELQGKLQEAYSVYRAAQLINSNYAPTYTNLGNILWKAGIYPEALVAYKRAKELNPSAVIAYSQLLHAKQKLCDFSVYSELPDALAEFASATHAVPPFPVISWIDSPKYQIDISRKWAAERCANNAKWKPSRPWHKSKRIKLAYFSSDFHDHATVHLISGLLREHDTRKFEVFLFSYGDGKSEVWQKKLRDFSVVFHEIFAKSDAEIVELARGFEIDIAIDLKGYTFQSRTEIFKQRIAPVQINYLGFPGSMGADFIDYIVADRTVIPGRYRKYYTEKVIYLPHTYQPNDCLQLISNESSSRSDFDLPDDAFVFCCFNNSYKISNSEFDIWMSVLRKVEGSVLWLLKSNQWVEDNLRKEAVVRGVDPCRLIFAEKLEHSKHLARHKHADLFLDCFNCNAHTTASDALWTGLPVVTKEGKQFAARVAASLLQAVGLNELITHSPGEYEDLIIELATNRVMLERVRERLARNILTEPLFDSARYTRNFERGLQEAFDLFFSGKMPQDIVVSDDVQSVNALKAR